MEMIYPPNFLATLKYKHLLLDTNIFRDAFTKPAEFGKFFNVLKENEITLITIDQVKFELLKGSNNPKKYNTKLEQINTIIDDTIPLPLRIYSSVYDLIKQYGIDGTGISITDLFLGALMIQYKPNLYLLTRDTTDFLQRIFHLAFIVNFPHARGIYTYGVYHYEPE